MDGIKPAFPCYISETELHESGLTKREYFAAMAMQGLLASYSQHDLTEFRELACDAFLMADAMIKESENATR